MLNSIHLCRKFGVPSKAFASTTPKIISVCHSCFQILDKVHYLLQIEFDQQINIYLVGRLFLTDKEDKINLREETPSRTSRIQLSKEMNMILTPLTKEIEEDDASHIYYMVYFSFDFHFVCLIVKSILFSASHLNSLW